MMVSRCLAHSLGDGPWSVRDFRSGLVLRSESGAGGDGPDAVDIVAARFSDDPKVMGMGTGRGSERGRGGSWPPIVAEPMAGGGSDAGRVARRPWGAGTDERISGRRGCLLACCCCSRPECLREGRGQDSSRPSVGRGRGAQSAQGETGARVLAKCKKCKEKPD